MTKDEIIARLTPWLESKGFLLMDDGTYQHPHYDVHVEFKQRVVRVDHFATKGTHSGYINVWARIASAPYKRITFEYDGRPRGLGFWSFKKLREITT